jgi:uncharacterized membrane protein
MKTLNYSKIFIICISIILTILISIQNVSIQYITSHQNERAGQLTEFEAHQVTEQNYIGDQQFHTTNTRAAKAGTLKWAIQLADEELSTPAICDLNPPEDKSQASFYEVVVASAADKVCAVDHMGTLEWAFTDCVIDNALVYDTGLCCHNIPPVFASVTPVDITGDRGSEIIVGEQDGVLCLSSDGTVLWKDKGTTDGYYFSNVAICDMEGDYQGIDPDGNDVGPRDDLEIILGSTHSYDHLAAIECWQANSNEVFRYVIEDIPTDGYLTSSIVTAELDGHFFLDRSHLENIRENDPETLYTDILISTYGHPGRIWSHVENGGYNEYYESALFPKDQWVEYSTHSSPVVGPFATDTELECIIGHGSPGTSWLTSTGMVRMYNQDGSEIVDPFTTGSAPSSVFSSPAGCDAQNLDPDKLFQGETIDYEIFFGCDNGNFYCLSATDLSEIWSYQTDGRILSSPAICNINSDDTLEVIIGSNDGFVYCFEADPQELDRNGEPHPKDDGLKDNGGAEGTYDILWKFDTTTVQGSSGEIGISSPVVGDLDKDGQLEVIIGDNGGMLYCINAGGKCMPGQVDWHKIHYDLNNTGFYNPKQMFGVMIKPNAFMSNTPKDEISKKVTPGKNVTYNLTVINTGYSKFNNKKDIFWLDAKLSVAKFGTYNKVHEWPKPRFTGKTLHWGDIDNNEKIKPYLILKEQDRASITLNVSVPWTCDIDEFCMIDVTVRSINNTFVKDTITLKATVQTTVDFKVEILKEPSIIKDEYYGFKTLNLNPGGSATVEVLIENTGKINDTYDLQLVGHQNFPDWTAYFDDIVSDYYPSAMRLDGEIMRDQFPESFKNNVKTTKFTIIAPPDADESEMLVLRLTGYSQYFPSLEGFEGLEGSDNYIYRRLERTDLLLVFINPVPTFELRCDEPLKYVDPGNDVLFRIDLVNKGNSKIYVKLNHSELAPEWGLLFLDDKEEPIGGSEAGVEVGRDSIRSIYIRLRPSYLVAAGSKLDVAIKGTTIEDFNITSTASVNIAAIAKQFYSISANATPFIQKVDPGDMISYNISIRNKGNGRDHVTIKPVQIEKKWKCTIYLESKFKLSTSSIPYNGTETFELRLKVPNDQSAGMYKIQINITSLGDWKVIDLFLEVNRIFDLHIYGVENKNNNQMNLNDTLQPMPGVAAGSKHDLVFMVENNGNFVDWIKIDLKPAYFSDSSNGILNIIDWDLFDRLGWKAKISHVTNSEVYIAYTQKLDFTKGLDFTRIDVPIAYLDNSSYSDSQISHDSLHDLNIKLNIGQRVWIKVELVIPRYLPDVIAELHPNADDPWYFALGANYYNFPEWINMENEVDENLKNRRVIIKLRVLRSDLEIFGNLIHTDNIDPSKDQIISVSANIRNIGNVTAESIVVTFYINNKELKSQIITRLAPGECRLIPFNWQTEKGKTKFKIVVDPINEIVEEDEKNNQRTSTVNIQSGDQLNHLSENERYLIYTGSLTLFVFVIILFVGLTLFRQRLKNSKLLLLKRRR